MQQATTPHGHRLTHERMRDRTQWECTASQARSRPQVQKQVGTKGLGSLTLPWEP